MTEPTDEQLLADHVAGDPHAFGQLFHRHRDRLWAVAVRTMRDQHDAEDALQDALLSAHRAAARFRGDAAVTTWLHRIVVNACLDKLRRRQAQPTVPLPDGGARADDRPSAPEPPAPQPDHDVRLVIREALAKLPIEQRSALVLVDVEGYSVAETAAMLEIAEGTVKSRCARGRARLALMLADIRSDLPAGGGNQTAPDRVRSAQRPSAPPAGSAGRDDQGGEEQP